MNQQAQFDLKERWNEILYDLIDYPPIESILKDFSSDFIVQLPFISENYIQEILI